MPEVFQAFSEASACDGVQKTRDNLSIEDPLDQMQEAGVSFAVPSHPMGVRPLGNGYMSTQNLKNAMGTFTMLTDESLVHFLEFLDASALIALGSTCKALYAFSRTEDLWKSLCVNLLTETPIWRGTWYATHRGIKREDLAKVSCQYLFSDVLHRPFVCTYISLTPFTTNIPSSNAIPRLDNLSPFEFANRWTDRPFILTQPVKQWPVYLEWTLATLLERHKSTTFRAESVDWPLGTYFEYMKDNQDESPLYLFDRSFMEKMSIQSTASTSNSAYDPPSCFGEDLFSVLSSSRPDYRWLIIGPARSGSTFHKDPNATSAWNAVLSGSKYWIMFPSQPGNPPPPGVFVSEDQSEVTSPLSIAEWLLSFHSIARRTPGCQEGLCHAGEVLHVPSGWWHLVVNLDTSIAITQNFVPEGHLCKVLDFLKNKPDQVSGFSKRVADPYDLFVENMRKEKPVALERAIAEMQQRQKPTYKRKWNSLLQDDREENEGVKRATGEFNFGFGDEDDEDVP